MKTAIVFGSYLDDADRIGDLDIAIELVPREADFDKHIAANYRRVSEHLRQARHFSNIVEQAFWWHQEALLYLRNRSRGLSLQDYGAIRKIVGDAPHKVVFTDGPQR